MLVASQELEFLGFTLNHILMTICLQPVKAATVPQACENLLNQENPTVRAVARVIELIVSSFPGVQLGELHFRYLEPYKPIRVIMMHSCLYHKRPDQICHEEPERAKFWTSA